MKGLLVLLPFLALSACSKLEEFRAPAPHHLLAHASWFDEQEVSVCGTVKHGQGSCTLEVCPDGSAYCPEPVSIWLSTTQHACYTGATAALAQAVINGRFVASRGSPQEPGPHYTLARATLQFVPSCGARSSEAAPNNSSKPTPLRGAA